MGLLGGIPAPGESPAETSRWERLWRYFPALRREGRGGRPIGTALPLPSLPDSSSGYRTVTSSHGKDRGAKKSPPKRADRQGWRAGVARLSTTVPSRAVLAARRTILARTGLVDLEDAAPDLAAIERVNGGAGFRVVVHGHETEAPRTTGFPVGHQGNPVDGAVSPEEILELLTVYAEGKISHVDIHCIPLTSRAPVGFRWTRDDAPRAHLWGFSRRCGKG